MNKTKATYEDPEVVDAYVRFNAAPEKMRPVVEEFVGLIDGKSILDLGCGPGQDAYIFAEHGFEVTGLDFSSEMVRRAKEFRQIKNMPRFIQGDFLKLDKYFESESFDAVWASTSHVHVSLAEIDLALENIDFVLKKGGVIHISQKAFGETVEKEVVDTKYGKETVREFTLWREEDFLEHTTKFNWEVVKIVRRESKTIFLGEPTKWMLFTFRKLG